MSDDKDGREKQARNADRRQRERDVTAALERGDEPEPPVETAVLGDLESALEAVEFPATGTAVVAAVGDSLVDAGDRQYSVAELVPETDAETFDSPAAVRAQVQRPTVAAGMKRIVEASQTLSNPEFPWSQRKAYETTFRELARIDTADEDEGIQAIADWVVDRIHDRQTLPGSRGVRREAAKFCRSNGYSVRDDEWLGI